ncbi:MAG: CPBP family intramembrane metalloprotease [Chloroflexaceae bacterium]|nr:CPBP family intramembrane metalloprotease [Chloroflexaceae bacterium]
MWAPGLGAIIATRFIADESLSTLHLRHLGPKPVYLWAWLVPPILALITGSLTPVFGAGRFDPTFPFIRAALATAPGGQDVPPAVVIAIQSALALTLFPLFNSIFAMGEELGWRGFLLPRLLPLGQERAILASGVIWGIWHAPAIAQGHNYPGHPILAASS